MTATRSEVAHWIGGDLPGSADRRLEIHDPATGTVVRHVALGDAEVVDTAVRVAGDAARLWSAWPVSRRVQVLRRWAALIEADKERFVALLGEEQGKVRADAEGELMRGLETLEVACAGGLLLKGELTEQVATGVDAFSVRVPLGVCAAVTPFNFPFMAPVYLSSIALACGNAMIVKPSERVPSASVRLAELAAEAGMPGGVLNIVQGDRVVVDALLDHPGIAAVSFIGSSPVARHVYTRGAAAGKRVQAFGGAKNHMVVMPDADLTEAADAAVSAAYGSSGQRCMAVSVVVAVGECAGRLVEAIAERAGRVRVGPASDAESEMGPVISVHARQRIHQLVDSAERAGATVALDGRRAGEQHEGYYFHPTLLDHVTPDMDVYTREVFGPVLSIVRVDSLDEAIDLIDRNPYGNGAALFTSSGAAARAFHQRVSVGMVGINVAIPIPTAVHSFGGWKDSRFGDQHMAGTEGFRFFTQQKVVTSRWPERAGSEVNLAFPGR